MNNKEILRRCFTSDSRLWVDYLKDNNPNAILYYPSTEEDFRPFLFSKKECLENIGVKKIDQYTEPNLFLFSDYFFHKNSSLFHQDSLFSDSNTEMSVVEMCSLYPTENITYHLNKKYIAFSRSEKTGSILFFKVKISTYKVEEPFYKYGIYFFYENVNLIEQLFLKNRLNFSHLVWKRDGSGFGGGRIKLDFICHVAIECNTKFFFLWDHYVNGKVVEIKNNIMKSNTPPEIEKYILGGNSILYKRGAMLWDNNDRVGYYTSI